MAVHDDTPLVSVILTTRDRPRFLAVALACYCHQSYSRRELIVIDDGEEFPADAERVAAAGGRLVRVAPGTPLGTKLNVGIEAARGRFCQKMDDDDWYAPPFLATMVSAVLASWHTVCRPTLAFLTPFLFFDVARWEIRRSLEVNIPGATLLFAREDGDACRFRPLRRDEDVWFLLDQIRAGVSPLPVRASELFLAVRHQGSGRDRAHTWTHYAAGQTLEAHLAQRPVQAGGPEALLPEWALAVYRELRHEVPASPIPPR